MTQLPLDTSFGLQKTEQYSIKTHLVFGGIVILSIFLICLFFNSIITEIIFNAPFFSCCIIGAITVGITYYTYKIVTFKKIQNNSLKKETDKTERFFNVLQTFIAFIGITSIIISVFNILQSFKNNITGHGDLLNNNYQILMQPFYIILISLTAISILFIFSLRIKETISQIHDIYNQGILNQEMPHQPQTLSIFNNGAYMSHNISDTATQNDDSIPFSLPNYDHGFFYKKLFEINDNILHLKRQIIVGSNDNTTEIHVHNLWEDKIFPFLTLISDRIKALEIKFDTYSQNTENNSDHLIVSKTLHSDTQIPFIHLEKIKISDNLSNNIKSDTSDIIAPDEEAFIHSNNPIKNAQKRHDLEIDIKQKTLEELRGFLESKMQQFYNNQTDTSVKT